MSIEHVRMRCALLVIALAAGCGEKRNPDKCLDGHCPDPSKPFCDEGGEIGGDPGACVAVECMPGEFGACRGDRAVMCNNTGDNYDLVDCTYGCSDAAGGCNDCNTAGCEKHIIPKYLPANICNEIAARPELKVSSDALYDVSNPLNCNSVVSQTAGPEICVLRMGTFTVEAGATLKIAVVPADATKSYAVAIVADRDVRVDGVIDVSAHLNKSGPGGGFVSGTPALAPNGGGGAGGKTAGAPGGTPTAAGGAANGGMVATNPALLTQLSAGAHAPDSNGGGGGGALTIVSCRGTVAIAGLINAGGGGGYAGYPDFGNANIKYEAGGGGAGGTVILQGMMVRMTGLAFANGGGGGGGSSVLLLTANGEDGKRALAAAQGSPGDNGGGRGGDGGFGSTPPTAGGMPVTAGEPAGAGGGSVGFFHTLTPQGVTPVVTPLMASPAFESNGTVLTN